MSIYSLIFLAPYELKQKIKTDRRLAFKQVMFRMAQRVLSVQAEALALLRGVLLRQ